MDYVKIWKFRELEIFGFNDSDDWMIVLEMSDCVREGTIILHNNWSLDIIWNNALPCPMPGYCLLLPPPGFNPRHSLLYFFGSLQDLDKFVVAYFREWAAWGVEREGWWLLRMLYWNWYPNIIITSLCFVINYVFCLGAARGSGFWTNDVLLTASVDI